MELRLTTPMPPSVNHYLNMRIVSNGKKIRPVLYGVKEANDFKNNLKGYIEEQVKEQGWELNPNKAQHYYCDCVFYFDRTGKDCNNYFKVLLDAITDSNLVWPDDKQVCERVNGIFYDKYDPRIEIVIRPVEYVGIFSSADEAKNFEDRCHTCNRYKRNCSILRQAKEGRIQPEICGGVCEKYKEAKT